MTVQGAKLGLDPAMVRAARDLARIAGQPIVDMARSHSTVSVERAVLRLAGLDGADEGGMPWSTAWWTRCGKPPGWSAGWRCRPGTRW